MKPLCHCCDTKLYGSTGSMSIPSGALFDPPEITRAVYEFHCGPCTEWLLRCGQPCHVLRAMNRTGPGYGTVITRTSLCMKCSTTIHYSPRAKEWWHRDHGSKFCVVLSDGSALDVPAAQLVATPMRPNPTPGATSGTYWTEETGNADDEAIIHTPYVHEEGELVQPMVRRVNGVYVMEG